jgi:hydrogenase nickel incorporation protein HypA/HybF
MTFCFDLCCAGTPLEGAALEILRIPARGRCPECATEVDVTDPLGGCACGSPVLDLAGGQELRIKEVEVL